jgi:glycosyltransferase involved in cell wall biosynthesis
VDAVLWFADAVWPQIKEKRPSATWAIVGQKPHPRLDRLRDLPGVILTGWVDKVEPYLYGATLFIMPFRIGSGTRLKLIEAMAAGCCIVSTSIGAEGFPVADGQQLFLTDTANEMAQTILFLLSSPIDRRQVQQRARDFAQQYDWRVIVPAFELVYESIQAG